MAKLPAFAGTTAKICLWATLPLAVIQLATTTTSLRMLLESTTNARRASNNWVVSGARPRLSPPPPTARRMVADALAKESWTGLDAIDPYIMSTEDALEHLEYYYPGTKNGVAEMTGRRILDEMSQLDTLVSTNATDADEVMMMPLPQTPQSPPLLIYFITPTYYRDTQMADMTRLAQTLMHDKRIYWLVVEDSNNCTVRMRALLERTGLPYAHVNVPTDRTGKYPGKFRGVGQRNRAIEIVEDMGLPGVVYFGDDDNAYDARLFEQLRQVKRVGVSGVMASMGPYERCVVNETTGKVQGFLSGWSAQRKFPIDMAGFAFRSELLHEENKKKGPLRFSSEGPRGSLESQFLERLVDSVDELEPLDNCTKLYAWHVKTSATKQVLYVDRVANDTARTSLLAAL